jgi:hypothetical protein
MIPWSALLNARAEGRAAFPNVAGAVDFAPHRSVVLRRKEDAYLCLRT